MRSKTGNKVEKSSEEYRIVKNGTTGLVCCLPAEALAGNTVKILEEYGYNTFTLARGEYVFVKDNPLEDRVLFVERFFERKDFSRGIIFKDYTGKILLPLRYEDFLYNPLNREIIIQSEERDWFYWK